MSLFTQLTGQEEQSKEQSKEQKKPEEKKPEEKKSEEKKPDIIDEKPIKLPESGGIKVTPKSVLEVLEFLGLATAETRAKVSEMAKGIREEALSFHPCFVKASDPEGSYFFYEDDAVEKWGVDGYKRVFRLADEADEPKPLGRLATKEETKACIKAEAAARKRAEKKRKEKKR